MCKAISFVEMPRRRLGTFGGGKLPPE